MKAEIRNLNAGYTAEVDSTDEEKWSETLLEFEDANIYQTWAYGDVHYGPRNISRLILTHQGQAAAAAQVRIVRVPFIKAGIAYVRWGPLWRRKENGTDAEAFRQAVRALRNEYVCR